MYRGSSADAKTIQDLVKDINPKHACLFSLVFSFGRTVLWNNESTLFSQEKDHSIITNARKPREISNCESVFERLTKRARLLKDDGSYSTLGNIFEKRCCICKIHPPSVVQLFLSFFFFPSPQFPPFPRLFVDMCLHGVSLSRVCCRSLSCAGVQFRERGNYLVPVHRVHAYTLKRETNDGISFRAIRCVDTTVSSFAAVTINERTGPPAVGRFWETGWGTVLPAFPKSPPEYFPTDRRPDNSGLARGARDSVSASSNDTTVKTVRI